MKSRNKYLWRVFGVVLALGAVGLSAYLRTDSCDFRVRYNPDYPSDAVAVHK